MDIYLILGVLAVVLAVLTYLVPESRHTVLGWLRAISRWFGWGGSIDRPTDPPETETARATESESEAIAPPDETPTATFTARDYVHLGELLWVLRSAEGRPTNVVSDAIREFTNQLERLGFTRTLAATRAIKSTTIHELEMQSSAIERALYTEATERQEQFIELGALCWNLCSRVCATPEALNASLARFIKLLDALELDTRQAAKPLEGYYYQYQALTNLVYGEYLDAIASAMTPIRAHLMAETSEIEMNED